MLKRAAPSLVTGASAIGLAVAAKAFYSTAGTGELLWILAPSAWLARLVGGIDLVYEPGAGFISHEHRLIVGPACAGINFLVICFLALYFSFASRHGSRTPWLASSVAIALSATVVANALRIVVSAHLWSASFHRPWLTPEEMHRAAGTVIYYGSLAALWASVDSWTRAGPRSATALTPWCWYVGVSLGVPLAHRLYSGGPTGFSQHAVQVLGVATATTLTMLCASAVLSAIRQSRSIR